MTSYRTPGARLKTHQPTTAATHRHWTLFANGPAEFHRLLVIPHINNLVRFDIADDIVVVIPAEANVTVAIDLHGHVDADTLVVPEGLTMLGVIALDFTACV